MVFFCSVVLSYIFSENRSFIHLNASSRPQGHVSILAVLFPDGPKFVGLVAHGELLARTTRSLKQQKHGLKDMLDSAVRQALASAT
jgi:hypothetical protein